MQCNAMKLNERIALFFITLQLAIRMEMRFCVETLDGWNYSARVSFQHDYASNYIRTDSNAINGKNDLNFCAALHALGMHFMNVIYVESES